MGNTDTLNEHLVQLVQETCSHPRGSLERQRGLNQMVGLIQQSDKLWKAANQIAVGDLHPDDYSDALQLTWLYVCRNLCEATTGNAYNPEMASLFTWINTYLKYRLDDQYRARQAAATTQLSSVLDDGQWSDPIQNLPAKPSHPPILEAVQDWVRSQQRGLRSIHVRDRPDINCYVLILRRLPPETAWSSLAEEFSIPAATLSGFYKRECLPRLRAFGQSEGYF